MKLSSPVAKEPQHILVFGDPKIGKSTLVSQLAEDGWNLIWISSDNGHSILRKLSATAQSRIELIRLPDTRDYPVAVDAFRRLFSYQPCNFCDTHGKHDCSVCATANNSFTKINLCSIPADTVVVWDNGSQLSDSYLSLITKGKPVDYKLQLDDWGSLMFHLKKGLMDIQVAPFHFIMIAHAVEEAMTDGSKKIMPAIGSSQFAPKVGGYFDHVIYCHGQNNKHKFASGSTYMNNVVTGSRTDVLIEKMDTAKLAPFFDGAPPKVDVVKPMLEAAAATVVATVFLNNENPIQQDAYLEGILNRDKPATPATDAAQRARDMLAKMKRK